MKIQIVSDLHTEFHRDGGRALTADLAVAARGVDVLVVAGDLAVSSGLHDALVRLCDSFPEVVFVLGNHDLYGASPQAVLAAMAKSAAVLPNLHWLNETTATVAGLRFAGTPLWFTLPRDHRARGIREAISDFRLIDEGYSAWAEAANARAVHFLAAEASKADIVVTHWLPSNRSVSTRFQGSALNAYFVTDIPEVVGATGTRRGPRGVLGLWIHGHTHDSCDYVLGNARVLCNPLGYPHEPNLTFQPGLALRGGVRGGPQGSDSGSDSGG